MVRFFEEVEMRRVKVTSVNSVVRRFAPIAIAASLCFGAAACGSTGNNGTNNAPTGTKPAAITPSGATTPAPTTVAPTTTAPQSGGAGF
jgi:hypothetical protein